MLPSPPQWTMTENRDGLFWRSVASHPWVKPHVALGAADFDIESVVAHPRVIPFASEHGGYLFFALDIIGAVYEVHAMYAPEGWGREAAATGKQALEVMFARGAQLIVAHEVQGNPRSAAPLSFGFRTTGGFEPSRHLGRTFRTWVLTAIDWYGSPARKRNQRKCPLS